MHLTTDTALDLVEGRLSKEHEVLWRGHMDVCNKCAKVVLQWQQVARELKRPHLFNAPERSIEDAMNIAAGVEPKPSPGKRSLLAAIIFDSLLQPAVAGVRG